MQSSSIFHKLLQVLVFFLGSNNTLSNVWVPRQIIFVRSNDVFFDDFPRAIIAACASFSGSNNRMFGLPDGFIFVFVRMLFFVVHEARAMQF